jgi:RHS repeat-associated protein
MVAEGKLRTFASTHVSSGWTDASEISSAPSNPKLETENSQSSNLLLSENSPHVLPLTLEDLDPIYTYDFNGNRVSMVDPTGLTTYAYDALNRLTSITNNKGHVTSFTYDALGRRTSMTHANGVVTNYTYDAASQLTRLAHQSGATLINSFDYTYDKVGNRKSKTSRDGLHDYIYDTLNRLTQATNPLPTNPLETFNFDPVGNRINSNQNGSSTFNQANQLLEDANFTYQYDNNGNQTRKTAKVGGAITIYEYDAENKLARVMTPSNTANYKYDGLGRRVEKEVSAGITTITKYVYDSEDILLELNGSNAIVARYTHGSGIDEPLIMEKNSQSLYYHVDGLGSITEITNQSGSAVQRYTYSSFGKIESQLDPNVIQPYRFTGREFDAESGLHFFRIRYYDSTSGRFIAEDPKGFAAGVNYYGYVGGNPTGRVDPYGLDWLTNLSNFSAGAGDYLSGGFMNSFNLTERFMGHAAIPISELLRKELVASIGLGDIVDQCSAAYEAGKYTGAVLGTSIMWTTGLNAGSNTVIFSPLSNAARAAKEGVPIGQTSIGNLLNYVDKNIFEIPRSVWYAASGTYVANASGSVNSVIDTAGKIVQFEIKILNMLNIPIVPR